MGVIITKFRKKKTTYEVLEKLEKEIQSIEEFRRDTEQAQKKMIVSAYERIIYIVPLVTVPILLVFIKSILTWYYNRKININQKKISTLKNEKRKILEEVMDKETYKVAKTILDKFAPEQVKKSNISVYENTSVRRGPVAPTSSITSTQTSVRYRGSFADSTSHLALQQSSQRQPQLFATPAPPSRSSVSQSIVPSTGRPTSFGTPLLLPRAILPRERTVLDKMVDYLVGDGPSNRYALICKNCSSHNGMALKEEFEYISFRCCYCLTFNPARKKRPTAPKIDTSGSVKHAISFESDLDRNSPSDTDSDSEAAGPTITEAEEDKPISSDRQSSLSESDKLSDCEMKSLDGDTSKIESLLVCDEENFSEKCETKGDAREINNGDTSHAIKED